REAQLRHALGQQRQQQAAIAATGPSEASLEKLNLAARRTDQLLDAHLQGRGHAGQHAERGIGGAALQARQRGPRNIGELGQALLGEAAFVAQLAYVLSKIRSMVGHGAASCRSDGRITFCWYRNTKIDIATSWDIIPAATAMRRPAMTVRLEHANLQVQDVEAMIAFIRTAFPDFRIRHDSGRVDPERWVHVGNDET